MVYWVAMHPTDFQVAHSTTSFVLQLWNYMPHHEHVNVLVPKGKARFSFDSQLLAVGDGKQVARAQFTLPC